MRNLHSTAAGPAPPSSAGIRILGYLVAVASSLVFSQDSAWAQSELPELLWVRVEDRARSVWLATDSQGNVITMAREGDHGHTALIKHDRDGNRLWRKEIESYSTWGLTVGPDDAIVGLIDSVVVKLTSEGDVQWITSLGWDFFARRICCDRFGNIFVVGSWMGIGTVKLSPAGEILWRRRGGGVWGSACGADGQGNVIVGGVALVGGWYDWRIIKYSSEGEELWVRTYGGPYDDEPSDICVDGDDNIYVSGGWLVKYDPEGNVIWENPTSDFSFGCLSYDGEGNIYASGWMRVGDGWYPGWGCFDLEGRSIWAMGGLNGCDGGSHFPSCSGADRVAVLQTLRDVDQAITTLYMLPSARAERHGDTRR